VTLSATSWQWRCNHAVFNRAKWNLQQLSDLTGPLADGLAERGLKVDYRTMWNFVHREGKSFKKNRVWR
jgi:transposase